MGLVKKSINGNYIRKLVVLVLTMILIFQFDETITRVINSIATVFRR